MNKCICKTKKGYNCNNFAKVDENGLKNGKLLYCNIHARQMIKNFKASKSCISPKCLNSKLYSKQYCLSCIQQLDKINHVNNLYDLEYFTDKFFDYIIQELFIEDNYYDEYSNILIKSLIKKIYLSDEVNKDVITNKYLIPYQKELLNNHNIQINYTIYDILNCTKNERL